MSFELIVVCDQNYGIGFEGKLPWRCVDELNLFKNKTLDSILIMGRKTVQNLPKLSRRMIVCLSKNFDKDTIQTDNNDCLFSSTFTHARQLVESHTRLFPTKVFIAGGGQIYREALLRGLVSKIHMSVMKSVYICDTFFPADKLLDFIIEEETDYPEFVHRVFRRINIESNGERQYLNLLIKTLNGTDRNGRNGMTRSIFGENLNFDLRQGFPLLTTKKMFFRGIVEELLFFIRGCTDSNLLEEKGVNIWKLNTDRKFLDSLGMTQRRPGVMGTLYGYQWRFFNAPYDEDTAQPKSAGIDQLKMVVDTIRNDPHSRRIIMTDYNPCQASQGVLYPCHSLMIQFYVDGTYLDMFCYNRSQDLFLGTPFNIASSALLLTLIARITNLSPRWLKMSLGDVHIYEQHLDVVQGQLDRLPYTFPKLVVKEMKEIADIENATFDDFILAGYVSHPTIKAEMVA